MAHGGGGYWINPGFGNRNYGFVGVALWRKVADAPNRGVDWFHRTPSAVDVRDSTGCNVGLTYGLAENWYVVSSVGSLLENRATTDQFSCHMALRLTF